MPDQGNNRVLVWNSFPTVTDQPADLVLGQPTMSSVLANTGLANPTAQTLSGPNWCVVMNGRLFLADAANSRVLIWNTILEQLRSSAQGCDATRKEILNWIIEKFPENLSATDLKELTERFYDEERFLKQALEQVRLAKSRGEKRTLEEIMQCKPNIALTPIRKPRKKKQDFGGAETGLEVSPPEDTVNK